VTSKRQPATSGSGPRSDAYLCLTPSDVIRGDRAGGANLKLPGAARRPDGVKSIRWSVKPGQTLFWGRRRREKGGMRSNIKRGCVMLGPCSCWSASPRRCGGQALCASPVKSREKPTLSEVEAPVRWRRTQPTLRRGLRLRYRSSTMELTRRDDERLRDRRTKAADGTGSRACEQYPDASFHTVPRRNADTLYTQGVGQCRKSRGSHRSGNGGRYYLLPCWNGGPTYSPRGDPEEHRGKAQNFAINASAWRVGHCPPGWD